MATRSGAAIEAFILGSPAVYQNRLLVGTENTGGAPNWLLCMDPSMGDMRRDPILGVLPFPGPVTDAEWINPELALVAEGEGNLHLIAISPANELKGHGTLPPIHTSSLRQIAINTMKRTQFASGGYDRKLCLVDLERPDTLQTLPQEGAIGSVTWPIWNQNVCPSLTTDDGTFLIIDTRLRPVAQPAFRATMGKKELFAHTRYTDNHVLLGYGDGEIQHIDVRVTDRILHRIKDPHVTAIGSLEYNHATSLLLVGGVNSASVWRVDLRTNEAVMLCNTTGQGGHDDAAHNVAFATDDSVVDCNGGSFNLTSLDGVTRR
jgi:WD40 repeat protein